MRSPPRPANHVGLFLSGRLPVRRLLTHRLARRHRRGVDRLRHGAAIRQAVTFPTRGAGRRRDARLSAELGRREVTCTLPPVILQVLLGVVDLIDDAFRHALQIRGLGGRRELPLVAREEGNAALPLESCRMLLMAGRVRPMRRPASETRPVSTTALNARNCLRSTCDPFRPIRPCFDRIACVVIRIGHTPGSWLYWRADSFYASTFHPTVDLRLWGSQKGS